MARSGKIPAGAPAPWPAGLSFLGGARSREDPSPALALAPGLDAPEHERALWWRENVVGLSRSELAKRIGYSETAIMNIELGVQQDTGRPVEERAMLRYRLACAAITLDVLFDWATCTLQLESPVTLSVECSS